MMLYSFLYEPWGVDLYKSATFINLEGEARQVFFHWLALVALDE